MDAVEPFVKNRDLFKCPDAPYGIANGMKGQYIPYKTLGTAGSNSDPTDDRWYGSYAINSAYWQSDNDTLNPPRKRGVSNEIPLSFVQAPATTIWAMDGNGSYQVSWPNVNEDPDTVRKDGSISYLCWTTKNINDRQEGAMVDRHQQNATVIYCDGHAKNVALSFLISPDQHTKKADGTPDLTTGFLRQFTPDDD